MDSSRGGRLGSSSVEGGTVSTGGIDGDATEVTDTAELLAGQMVGEYRILGPLGQGGMGRVYSAEHPVIAKKAAIKVLHPELSVNKEAVDRFVQEARSVNQIGHPNIVDIFSFGRLPDGRNYFVMEWLRGESLRDRIRRSRLTLPDALAILETITLPLEAAHEKGIVHRDLKPDNVFLVDIRDDRPQVKLLDFGIAKLMGGQGLQRTQTGNMLGTPAYISPEQARAEGVDHRTDIYALGAMGFELLTSEYVFTATNAADMIAQHLFQPPRSARALNPAVPAGLDILLSRMLAKPPQERPALAEIRNELRAMRLMHGVATPPHGIAQHATPPPGKHVTLHTPSPHASALAPGITVQHPRPRSRLWVIPVVLLVGAGIATAVVMSGPRETKPTPAESTRVEQATPVETAPVEPAPVEPAATTTPPSETKPAEPAPVDKTRPAEPAPVDKKKQPPAAPEQEAKTTDTKPIKRDGKKRPAAKPTTSSTKKPTTTKPPTKPETGPAKPYDPDAPM